MAEVQQKKQQSQNELNENLQSTRLKKVLDEEITPEEISAGELDQLELLQEVYKSATQGMQSVEVIRPMIKDKALKSILFRQYNSYKALTKEIELQAATNGYDLRASTFLNKAMMYGSLLLNTITDRSSSKLAEVMIQGINMGIISLVKVKNNIDPDIKVDMTFADKLMDILRSLPGLASP
ncbi:MAG: hypothetical protein PHC84_04690 [Clostridia bacterium]|nr:hypothetical protein [Clostridia bacterium]